MKGTWVNLKGEFNHLVIDESDDAVETVCKHLHSKEDVQCKLESQPNCLSCWNRRHGVEHVVKEE